jgi:CMP-N,N'-diacetyllegionaminic acid synthase
MISGLSILAVIPARGGSKGIPFKNLKKVGGKPIVELAAQVASSVKLIDRVVVSTDSEKIANAAINGGASFPFRRPKILSGDKVSDLEVLTHALNEMEYQDKKKYDIVVMLQPTSPLRTTQHVVDSIEMFANNDYDSVWTVSETDSKNHPLKQLIISQDSQLNYYDQEGSKIIARQQLEPVYHRNGIAYVISRECLIEKKSIMGGETGVVICKGDHVSIDTEWDLFLVEMINSGKFKK